MLPADAHLTLGTYGAPLSLPFVLGPAEIATHKHVIGVTGQGKSKLLASMFVQLMNQGIGTALIDPHTDLAMDVLGILADGGYFERPDAYKRLLYVDFADKRRFLPFNVLNQPFDDHTVARNVVEACKRAWPILADGSAPQFENIFLAGSLVLVQNKLPLWVSSYVRQTVRRLRQRRHGRQQAQPSRRACVRAASWRSCGALPRRLVCVCS